MEIKISTEINRATVGKYLLVVLMLAVVGVVSFSLGHGFGIDEQTGISAQMWDVERDQLIINYQEAQNNIAASNYEEGYSDGYNSAEYVIASDAQARIYEAYTDGFHDAVEALSVNDLSRIEYRSFRSYDGVMVDNTWNIRMLINGTEVMDVPLEYEGDFNTAIVADFYVGGIKRGVLGMFGTDLSVSYFPLSKVVQP